jgi:hypothetical protein
MLEKFVSTDPEDLGDHALGWVIYLAIGLGFILALAVFIKLNFHDEGGDAPLDNDVCVSCDYRLL